MLFAVRPLYVCPHYAHNRKEIIGSFDDHLVWIKVAHADSSDYRISMFRSAATLISSSLYGIDLDLPRSILWSVT